jgi:hypothetical protein
LHDAIKAWQPPPAPEDERTAPQIVLRVGEHVPRELRDEITECVRTRSGEYKQLIERCKAYDDGHSVLFEARRFGNSRYTYWAGSELAKALDDSIENWQPPGANVSPRAPSGSTGGAAEKAGARSGSPLGVSQTGAWSDLQQDFTRRQEEIVKWVQSGGNINWTCAEGMTLLHYAAMLDNERMVRFLLDRGASVNAEAKFKMTPLLWACKSISTSVIRTLLDRRANPNAKSDAGYTALQFIRRSGLDAAENAAKLLISRGAVATPGRDSPCPECGAPYSAEMAKRGVRVTINREYAEFACFACKKQQQADLEFIDKAKGVQAQCSCGSVAYIPPSVWCKTCGGGLSTGWQKHLSTGPAAETAQREFNDSGVKLSRTIARDLKATHGNLRAIHFKSHYPDFGIDFDFTDGKRISSGATSGDIVGTFAFGYIGGGPNRLQTFLDEMGLSISVEKIEKLKPGTTLKVEGTSLRDARSRS